MEGLYKRVIRGKFTRIPNKFSEDMNKLLHKMIKVNPHSRPSCDELLNSTYIQNHMYLLDRKDSIDSVNEKQSLKRCQSSLLNTIKLPRDLKQLTNILPAPNYKSVKENVNPKIPFLG